MNLFGSTQQLSGVPDVDLPVTHKLNDRLSMDALQLLAGVPDDVIPAAFFDPQYRGVLDKMAYGNEGKARGKERCDLPQMTSEMISGIARELCRVLVPSGHLFLWVDKFHLCEGYRGWLDGTILETVDLVTWHKQQIGMGYRTRRTSEHLVVLQKAPRRAKGLWRSRTIPDVWSEKTDTSKHIHSKPVILQCQLIEAVTHPNDIVLDPAAGSFSVMKAALLCGRNFLGSDITAEEEIKMFPAIQRSL